MATRKLTQEEINLCPKLESIAPKKWDEQQIRLKLSYYFKDCKKIFIYNSQGKITMTGAEFSRAILKGLAIDKYTSFHAPVEEITSYTTFAKGYLGGLVLNRQDCIISKGYWIRKSQEDDSDYIKSLKYIRVSPYARNPELDGYSFYEMSINCDFY